MPTPPSKIGKDLTKPSNYTLDNQSNPVHGLILTRCPVILCKAIDHLHRERNVIGRELGEESREGVKKVVEELSKLR